MRFGKNLTNIAIPQWKSCYLDYQHLKIFVRLIKEIVEMIQNVEKQIKNLTKQNKYNIQNITQNEELQQNKNQEKIGQYQNTVQLLKQHLQEVNKQFIFAHRSQMNINCIFIQMKLLQLNATFEKLKKINNINLQKEQNSILLSLIQYVYIQAIYMENTKDINNQGQRKILKKHLKYAKKLITTPKTRTSKINRLSLCIKTFYQQIQDLYVQISEGSSKKNRQYLRSLAKKTQSESVDTFIFGSWVGICLSVLIVLLVILIYQQKNVQIDPVFNRDFPTWRGIAFFIIYIWILGMNTYMFQKYCVSHRIIFKHEDHHHSTAIDMFKVAGFFTTLFFILFLIYTLQLTQIAVLQKVGQHYLNLFVWGPFILYLIFPLPILNWRGRLFAWKLALISMFSPFLGVTFPVIWFTDQLVSLVTPFKDFAYTICYYTLLNLQLDIESSDNTCNDATRIEVVFVVGAIAYGYRIIQCMRQGYDKGIYLFQPQFFNTIKYISSLITLTLSFFWKAGNDQIFAAWLFFAAFSTIYSYIWDIKMDWGLMESETKHKFLRNNLTYTPKAILAWVLTLSPSIVQSFGSPQLFTFITGALQILRRGFWNLFRVQKQHLINCKNFQAISDQKHIEEKLFIKLREKAEQNFLQQPVKQCINSAKQQQETYKQQIYNNFHPLIEELINKQNNQKEQRIKKIKQIKKSIQKINISLKNT